MYTKHVSRSTQSGDYCRRVAVLAIGLAFVLTVRRFGPYCLSQLLANLATIRVAKSGIEPNWATNWHWDADGHLLLNAGHQEAGLTSVPGNEEAAQAVRYSLVAVTLWSDNMLPHRTLAYLALGERDYEALEEHLSILVEKDAQRPWNALALAKLYEWQGEHDLAVEELRRSGTVGYLLSIAEHALSGGQVENARRLATVAIEAGPDFPQAYRLLGHILVVYGTGPEDVEYAVEVFGRGLQLQPESTSMRVGLAHALIQAGRYDEALDPLRIVLSKAPDNGTAHLLLGEVYLHQGNLADATSEYLTCLNLAPDHVWALYGLGRVYAAQGRRDDAIATWQRALEVDPNLKPALRDLNTISK